VQPSLPRLRGPVQRRLEPRPISRSYVDFDDPAATHHCRLAVQHVERLVRRPARSGSRTSSSENPVRKRLRAPLRLRVAAPCPRRLGYQSVSSPSPTPSGYSLCAPAAPGTCRTSRVREAPGGYTCPGTFVNAAQTARSMVTVLVSSMCTDEPPTITSISPLSTAKHRRAASQ